MENLLQIIFILSVVKYACKATFYKNYRGILLFALLAGVFAYAIHPFAIQNNIRVFTSFLSDKNRVTGLAMIITIEAITGILISIAMLQDFILLQKKRNRVKVLRLLPGIMVFGAFFYIELKSFYFFSGFDFRLTALIISTGLFVFVVFISAIIKYALPGKGMRYEFKFLLNNLLLIMAVILNAGLADYNQSNYNMESVLLKLLVFILLVIAIGTTGYLLSKRKNKGKLKILNKWI